MQSNARLVVLRVGRSETIPEDPFSPEEKLEIFLFTHPEVLGEVVILDRQSGTRTDRPDLIGVDGEGNVLVIEVKDEAATYDVVSQVLRYALWAKNNPDSVRVLWHKLSKRPSGREPDWSDLSVKIVVVAPDFEQSVLRATSAVRYSTSLIQLNRFASNGNEFVVVREVSLDDDEGSLPVRTKGDYTNPSWHRGEMGRNSNSIQVYFQVAKEIEKLTASRGWPLDTRYNQNEMNMKLGAHVAFGIAWDTTKSLYLYFHHVPLAVQRKFKRLGVYRSQNPAYCYMPVSEAGLDLRKFDALFGAAFEGTRAKYGS